MSGTGNLNVYGDSSGKLTVQLNANSASGIFLSGGTIYAMDGT